MLKQSALLLLACTLQWTALTGVARAQGPDYPLFTFSWNVELGAVGRAETHLDLAIENSSPWRASPDGFALARDYAVALGTAYPSSQWPASLRAQLLSAIASDQGWQDQDWNALLLRDPPLPAAQHGLIALLAQQPQLSAALFSQVLRQEPAQISTSLREWLNLFLAIALEQSGQHAPAGELLQLLVSERDRSGSRGLDDGWPAPDSALYYDWLGHVQRAGQQWAAAELSYRRALQPMALPSADKGAQLARAQRLENLAELVQLRERFYGAEQLYRDALEIYLTELGPWHRRSAHAMKQLASSLEAQEQWAEATVFRQQALILDEELHGRSDPMVAESLSALARLEQRQGQTQQALEHWQRALAIDQLALGAAHPKIMLRLNHVASALKALGQLDEAEQAMVRVLHLAREHFGPQHPNTALALNNLAGVLRARGEWDQAEELYRAAIEVDERALGPVHPSLASDFNNLAHLLHSMNRHAESEYYMRRSLEIVYQYSQHQGLTHPYLTGLVENYSLILSEMGYSYGDIDRRLHFLMPNHKG